MAERAKCMGNMRGLHLALSSYLNEKNHWPQPSSWAEAEGTWWIQEMEPYGADAKMWHCPTITRMEQDLPAGQKSQIHYWPTLFDDKPMTARRWATMPWLTEIADAHGDGALIIFTDGSIKGSNAFMPR